MPSVAGCGLWRALTPEGVKGRPVGERLSSRVGQRLWLVLLVPLLPQLCVQLLVSVAVLHLVWLPLGCVQVLAGPRFVGDLLFAAAAIVPFAVHA